MDTTTRLRGSNPRLTVSAIVRLRTNSDAAISRITDSASWLTTSTLLVREGRSASDRPRPNPLAEEGTNLDRPARTAGITPKNTTEATAIAPVKNITRKSAVGPKPTWNGSCGGGEGPR